jgi:hypothetical protein
LPLLSIAVCVCSWLLTQTRRSTGSSDREATALAVMPAGAPSCFVVMIVTPVAKWPIASRNSASSTDVPAPGAEAGCTSRRISSSAIVLLRH